MEKTLFQQVPDQILELYSIEVRAKDHSPNLFLNSPNYPDPIILDQRDEIWANNEKRSFEDFISWFYHSKGISVHIVKKQDHRIFDFKSQDPDSWS